MLLLPEMEDGEADGLQDVHRDHQDDDRQRDVDRDQDVEKKRRQRDDHHRDAADHRDRHQQMRVLP